MYAWLKCQRIARGMFSDERVITIIRSDGKEESFIVPQEAVQEDEQKVRVELLDESYDKISLAEIPSDQPSVILVNKDKLCHIKGASPMPSIATHGTPVNKVSHYLRRLVEEFETALEETDPLARFEVINEAKDYWGLAYSKRKDLGNPARMFLTSLLIALEDPVLVDSSDAMRCFIRVTKTFARFLDGCTDKDVEVWLEEMEDAGFDFARPLKRECTTRKNHENEKYGLGQGC